jgi:hypothetical protein
MVHAEKEKIGLSESSVTLLNEFTATHYDFLRQLSVNGSLYQRASAIVLLNVFGGN